MSANTSISEGGKARPFGPVKDLMVQGEDGKYYPWFPESDRALGTLSVDKNGVYRASDKGIFGWGQVYVNVAQTDSVTGKDPDTGEEVVVRPDPETGDIVKTVVPTEIRVIEPPTNPYGTYVDGQTITKDGMVVKAYIASGELWTDESHPDGVVPNGEITLVPGVAEYDASTERPAEYTSPLVDGHVVAGAGTFDTSKATQYMADGAYVGPATATRISSEGAAVVIASSSSSTEYGYVYYDENGQTSGYGTYGLALSFTYDGKTVYYSVVALPNFIFPVSDLDPSQSNVSAIAAWTMVYGTQVVTPGSVQTITASWPRIGDGAVLETTFDILVGPHGGGPTGED